LEKDKEHVPSERRRWDRRREWGGDGIRGVIRGVREKDKIGSLSGGIDGREKAMAFRHHNKKKMKRKESPKKTEATVHTGSILKRTRRDARGKRMWC